MALKTRAVVRGALLRTARSTTKSTRTAGTDTEGFDYMFELPTGLDAFDGVEVIEKKEYVVPVPVICLFDEVEGGGRVNVRFARSGVLVKDKAGKSHKVYILVEPIIDAEAASTLPLQAEGTLTVKVAASGENDAKWEPFMRYGRPTGDVKLTFTCAPDFVKFVPTNATADKAANNG